MNILVVGGGVVGTATAQGFQRLGHRIKIVDAWIDCLAESKGFEVETALRADPTVELAFICTPEKVVPEVAGELHKTFAPLRASAATLSEYAGDFPVYIRSSVTPGTCAKLSKEYSNWHFGHNPEFLREAVAEYEFLNPTGVVLGNCCYSHGTMMAGLYSPLRVPIHLTTPEVSEFTKLCVNGYLAAQVSFWNQVKILADSMGINSHAVGMLAARCDNRISPYGSRMHGESYGGHCLPKDIDQLLELCRKHVGEGRSNLFEAVKFINQYLEERRGN